jgi:hypothetical protein
MQKTRLLTLLVLLLTFILSEAGTCYSTEVAHVLEEDSDSFELDYGHLETFQEQCTQACNDRIGVMVNPSGILNIGQIMHKHSHIASPNKKYFLVFQKDGNLVAYEGPHTHCTCENFYGLAVAYWATNTMGGTLGQDCEAIFQADSNFAIYCGTPRTVYFATNTQGTGANQLKIQDDGNVVLYKDTQVIWASNTVRS